MPHDPTKDNVTKTTYEIEALTAFITTENSHALVRTKTEMLRFRIHDDTAAKIVALTMQDYKSCLATSDAIPPTGKELSPRSG